MENLKYTELLQQNQKLIGKIASKQYSIGVISNVTINSFKEVLEYACRSNQIEPYVELGNYDNIVQDSVVFGEKDLVIIFYELLNIIDHFSGFFEDVDEGIYNNFKQKVFTEIDLVFDNLKHTPSVIFNSFSSSAFITTSTGSTKIDTFAKELNRYLDEKKTPNVTIVDINKIYQNIGLKQSIDFRFYYSSKAPYTFSFFKNYASAIESLLMKNTGRLKKAIIFDCDNTLWKGIIGEDGIENIDFSGTSQVGKFFQQVQQIAVFLSKRGVIVGICSKNNEQDVVEVLKNHKGMVLKDEHIVIRKINWNDKATNLIAIASELNIGIDSLVFVDDSSFEINLVRDHLPEVLTFQVPDNISEYPGQLLKLVYKYFNLSLNSDDARKTEMYKQQFQRENQKNAYSSIDEYLGSLNIELTIVKNDPKHIPRVAQLSQKTNQFNLTTYRYTETQIAQFIENKQNAVYAMFVKDTFGDSGLTGICVTKEDEQNASTVIIDSYLMSCRIIGRNIELAFMNYVIEELVKKGYKTIIATYIPTKKNTQVENFYHAIGFELTGDTAGVKNYSLNLSKFTPKEVSYIKIN